jgi:hypothetical protein
MVEYIIIGLVGLVIVVLVAVYVMTGIDWLIKIFKRILRI